MTLISSMWLLTLKPRAAKIEMSTHDLMALTVITNLLLYVVPGIRVPVSTATKWNSNQNGISHHFKFDNGLIE
jgi:hypothetical protein